MHGLVTTASKRTSENFAAVIIHAITRALKKRYDFLKYINFNIKGESKDLINISSDLNSIDPIRIGKAVEALVQVICMDFKDKAGLYFINEFKEITGKETISDLKEVGIDFDLLQIQQHYLYRQNVRIKDKSTTTSIEGFESTKEKGLLDYSWENISKWDYDTNTNSCKIYDKDGKLLDQLDLDEIVKKYIHFLTNGNSVEKSTDYKMEEKEKSLKLKND
jgi:hypothetical protein